MPWYSILGLITVAAPALLVGVLGISSLLGKRLPERVITRLAKTCTVVGLLAGIAVLAWMLSSGNRHLVIDLGHWVSIPHYHFAAKVVFDRLSVPFVILSFALTGTIGAFAERYMHREPGFHRFFALYAIFLLGMVVTSIAGTVETLFTGWELVGLSSALLVAFFHERPAPVQNGLRIWCIYRVSDAALLLAALLLHHMTGEGDFDKLMGTTPWPMGHVALTATQALGVGLLLLVAVAGKSALVPFSGWLPRAMEGPTPSSAIFYGALSVHLGAFLLLRVGPLLDASLPLRVVIIVLGLLTALHASITARVQTDIKSALSYACLTQVGIIVAEIGFGLRYIALIHILGHAFLRTMQFVRAPTLLQDYRVLEDALGARLAHSSGWGLFPARARLWLYRFALERGYLDSWLNNAIVRPLLRTFEMCDRLERSWTNFLTGGESRESDLALGGVVEELQ